MIFRFMVTLTYPTSVSMMCFIRSRLCDIGCISPSMVLLFSLILSFLSSSSLFSLLSSLFLSPSVICRHNIISPGIWRPDGNPLCVRSLTDMLHLCRIRNFSKDIILHKIWSFMEGFPFIITSIMLQSIKKAVRNLFHVFLSKKRKDFRCIITYIGFM